MGVGREGWVPTALVAAGRAPGVGVVVAGVAVGRRRRRLFAKRRLAHETGTGEAGTRLPVAAAAVVHHRAEGGAGAGRRHGVGVGGWVRLAAGKAVSERSAVLARVVRHVASAAVQLLQRLLQFGGQGRSRRRGLLAARGSRRLQRGGGAELELLRVRVGNKQFVISFFAVDLFICYFASLRRASWLVGAKAVSEWVSVCERNLRRSHLHLWSWLLLRAQGCVIIFA